MAEGTSNPTRDLGWFLAIIAIFFIIWLAGGGASRPPQGGLFSTSTPSASNSQSTISSQGSPYKGKVRLQTSNARESNPKREYVEINAASNNTGPIIISGWTLTGREGLDIAIGTGTILPFLSQINTQYAVSLEPGGKAIIVTGQSPVGTGFRLNTCTGYFNQFQEFNPRLPQECPEISEENLPGIPLNFYDNCIDYLRSTSRCIMPLSVPPSVGNDCVLYISEKANYVGCVTDHKNEPDFYKKEWRLYLGRDKELWANQRDTIILRDDSGRIIDRISYD